MSWLKRVRNMLRRDGFEADLNDELRDHLEQETQNNIRAGMTAEEAKLAARRLTGSLELHKEECRDVSRVSFLETSWRDLRYALRMLRRTPLFTVVGVVTLAIGIGANTTVFTFVENILLRSLPIHEPEQIDVLNWGQGPNMSYLNYVDFRDRNTSFSNLVAYRYVAANMSSEVRGNFRGWGYEATGNYFQTLGVTPSLGRFFGPEVDAQLDAHPEVVISYRCWQTRFGGDRDLVGKTLKINGFPFTIVGVAGASFSGTELIVDGEYWVPMSMEHELEPGSDWMKYRTSQNAWVLGRRLPNIPRAQAEANLNDIAAQIVRQYPDAVSGRDKFELSRPGLIGNAFRGPVTEFGIVLLGVAALGLLLACVNLAGMLLARASDRRREVGIRLAIGATQGQLLRQLMTESMLLAVTGGLLGLGLAYGACWLLNTWKPAFDIPVNVVLTPNGLVLAFTVAVAFLTTIVFGLAPAVQTVRVDLVPSLKNEPVAARFRRWSVRDLLVTGQIALSVMLVICSVLVVRSLQHALTLQLGFNPNNAVSISFDLGLKGYDAEHIRRFQAELLRRASNLPGMDAVGIVNTLPLSTEGEDSEFMWPDGQPMPKPADRPLTMLYNSSAGYLKAAGTRLLAGRDFDTRDRHDGQAVAIVNQTFGRRVFGDENPVGRHVRISSADGGIEIVGVIEDGKYTSLGENPFAAMYLPITQHEARWTTLVARTPLAANQVAAVLRKTVLDMDPDITIFNAGSLREHLGLPLLGARMAAIVLGTFGVFAMALAAIGLFALMSYAVSRRTREIGIRMALGARRAQVLSLLMSRTLLLCAVGISVGSIATLASAGLLSAVLYGVSPRDPVTYLLVFCLMTAVALAACWTPATRAIRIDPTRALREE